MAKSNFIETKKAVDDITTALDKQIAIATELSTEVAKLNTNYKNVPSKYFEEQKKIADINYKVARSEKEVQNAISATERAKQSKLRTEKLVNTELDRQNKQLEKEQAQLAKSENAYERVKAKINSMLPVYNNLKTKVELGLKLSKAEERQLALNEGRLIKYRETLNKVNKAYGNYSLEVGNYAKGNTNLANAVGQISRELPNFGQSFQIGVLSLTNNIGALIDGIAQVKAQNEILRQQGMAQKSIFSTLTSAILSWQTALFIGIGFFSAYSQEMGDYFKVLSKGRSQLTKLEKDYLAVKDEANVSAGKEIANLDLLYTKATALNVPMEQRNLAVKELQEQYPSYFKNMDEEAIKAGRASSAYDRLSKSLIQVALNQAIMSKLSELQGKMLDADLEYAEGMKNIQKANFETTDEFGNVIRNREAEIESFYKRIKNRKDEIKKEIDFLTSKATIIDDQSKDKGKAQKDRIELDYAEVESKYKLRIAKLELLKAQQQEIAENENAYDVGRLEARKEYSRLEAEIITANYELETELSKKQFDDDQAEAKKKYEENKKNGYNDIQNNVEFAKAKQDILNKYLNNTVTATENRDKQIYDLMIQDAEFAEKIRKAQFEKEEDHRKKTLEAEMELALALNKVEQKKFLKFSEDNKRTVKARELAFLEYKRLALAQIDLEMLVELSKADPEKHDVIRQKYAELRKEIEKQVTPIQAIQKETEKWIDSFKTKPINDFQKALDDVGLSSLKMFTDFDEAGETTFSKMYNYAKNTSKGMQVALLAVSEVAQDVFNLMSEASNANFQAEYANLEKKKNISLAFAGESESARVEIERQAEEKRKEIAKREFKQKQKMAEINVLINTSQAIMSIWGHSPDPTGISQGTMTAIIAGISALQLAIISSQKMPEYWKGTDNANEGWALTQEKGREIITDKNNKIKSLGNDKGATKTWLNKGDKVIPNAKTMKHLMFNNELNGILTNNQISSPQPIVNVNSGFTDGQVDRIVSTIKNKTELHVIKDKFGERAYERKQNQIREIADARVNFKPTSR